MELNQIRYFVTLARLLHFTRAADACNVSQPALTKAIQRLEEELGGPLLLRERTHTQLTDLGRLMLDPLERALKAAQDAKTQAAAFRRRETSPLRIGLEYSVPISVLTPVLAALRRHTDEIDLTLRQGAQADLCERMLSGELDFALLVETEDLNTRLHRWRMFMERYVLLCPPDHPFGDRAAVGLRDLADECLLLNADAACPVRAYLAAAFDHADLQPRRTRFAASQEQLQELALASLGICVAGDRTPCPAALVRRPLAADGAGRNVVLAAAAGRQMGPTAALFQKLMRARAWGGDRQEPPPDAEAA